MEIEVSCFYVHIRTAYVLIKHEKEKEKNLTITGGT